MKSIEELTLQFMSNAAPLFNPEESAKLQAFLDPNNSEIPWDNFLKVSRECAISRLSLSEAALTMTCPLRGTIVINPDAIGAMILNAFWHGIKAAQDSRHSQLLKAKAVKETAKALGISYAAARAMINGATETGAFENMMKKMMEGE